jgi:hypothetical protein
MERYSLLLFFYFFIIFFHPTSLRFPSTKLDDINVWDDVLTVRSLLLEKLYARFVAIPNSRMMSEKNLEVPLDDYRRVLVEEKVTRETSKRRRIKRKRRRRRRRRR